MHQTAEVHVRRRLSLAAAAAAAALLTGLTAGAAGAQGTAPAPAASPCPLTDDWKAATLDPSWHVTVLGDAQEQDSSLKPDNGLLHLMAAGSDTWVGGDNNLYLWKPMNGDFQVVVEIHSIAFTNQAAKLGIMVRSSLSKYSPNVFCQAMPKGGDLQVRSADATIGDNDTGPGSGCPGDNCVAWGDPNNDDPNRPVILQRLTRRGDMFMAERSYDMGKTWGGLHTGSLAAQDIQMAHLPDDVLVGIAYDSHDVGTVGEAVAGPISCTQLATRPTGNGLAAATAVDASGKPVEDVGVVLLAANGTDRLGTTVGMDSSDSPIGSDTASFFLLPGKYMVQAAENDTYAAGAPVPFEIKAAGDIVDVKVPVGKAK